MLTENVLIPGPGAQLSGRLSLPQRPIGLALIVHPASPKRGSLDLLLERLSAEGIGALTVDLLNKEEELNQGMLFNIRLLSKRLEAVLDWAAKRKALSALPLGLIGAQTGAPATAMAAAQSKHEVAALASLNGRVDMAEKYLPYIDAPCLLLASKKDELTFRANQKMMDLIPYARLHALTNEENGESAEEVAAVSARWFKRYFNRKAFRAKGQEYNLDNLHMPFYDRHEAARFLARRLWSYQDENPVILAPPKAAVVMADIIATELDCEMDVLLMKEIYEPGSNADIGAVNEFGDVFLNSNPQLEVGEKALQILIRKATRELREYREKLPAVPSPVDLGGRTVIIVDDGVARGSIMLSAVITAKEKGARKVVAAAPVASPLADKMLRLACDETVFLNVPENFYAIGQFYENYPQIDADEIQRILR